MNNTLIERYLTAVGHHLPQKGRQDVQDEIRTLIEDMLEDRYPETAPDEEQIAAVLKELGDPEKIAGKFQPEKYLIGPQMYPIFIKVFQIVVAAVSGGLLLSLFISKGLYTAGQVSHVDWGTTVLNFLPGLFSGLLSAFAILVMIFAVIERSTSPIQFEIDQGWKPADLPELEGPEPFRPVKLTWEIAFAFLAGMVINIFPQWVGVFTLVNGEWSFMPLLSPTFFDLVPYINVGIGLVIALNLYILAKRGWTPVREGLKFATDIYQLVVLLLIASRPVFGLNPETMAYHNISPANVNLYDELLGTINFPVTMALWVAIMVIGGLKVIDLIKRLPAYHALLKRR